MLFNSLEFVLFFAIVFVLYWFVLKRHLKWQNALLLLSSYIFYGWWDWRFLSLIVISSAVDFFLGQKIHSASTQKSRKLLLITSLVVNLGFLGFFKYYNFFIESFQELIAQLGLNWSTGTLNIVLPVGISFYTFQTLSYTIDIYKRKMEPTKNMLHFFTFVAFFPQLVAGPIERAKHLLPQFEKPRTFDYSIARSGGQLILVGFFKKIVIADSLSVLVDAVYSNPEAYIGFPMVVATVFFAFQIYCDFSGYSDIAIGTSRLLGFDLMTNFNKPYFSTSLTDFWHRWHISLSTWFRDYVYIPLGGNKTSPIRTNFNLLSTFIISGLWHGANWTFVVWGGLHGSFLIIEKTISGRKRVINKGFIKLIFILITFAITCFAWIFFRSNSISDAFFIISHMFSDLADYTNPSLLALKFRGIGLNPTDLLIMICFLLLLVVSEAVLSSQKLSEWILNKRIVRWSVYYFLIVVILLFATKNNAGNFIYFQF